MSRWIHLAERKHVCDKPDLTSAWAEDVWRCSCGAFYEAYQDRPGVPISIRRVAPQTVAERLRAAAGEQWDPEWGPSPISD